MSANTAYWRAAGGNSAKGHAVARKLAGRWIEEPAGQGHDVTSLLDGLTPKDLAACTDVGTPM